MKKIIINVSGQEGFFRRYVEVLRGVLKLRGKEADVFMLLLYYRSIYPEEKFISEKIRRELSNKLGMSMSSINNCLCSLRYRNFVEGVGQRSRLNNGYLIPYRTPYTINFEIRSS